VDAGPAAEVDGRAVALAPLRAVLGSATLVMLGLSWPLWTAPGGWFPRVPFVKRAAWLEPPPALAWIVFAAACVAVALGAWGRRWRGAMALSQLLLVALVLQDQHRFQPWVYQYLMVGLLLVGLSPASGVRHARWWFAGLYFHSGLSKLDVSFVRELGSVFLATLVRPLGLDPASWPEPWRVSAILAMPAAEIVVAVLLIVPRTQRVGLAGALVIHAALLVILGPWGLAHSTIVLVWNAAVMVEVALLFSLKVASEDERERWPARVIQIVFWAALVAPFGERLGLLDAWPAHALYASHAERTTVFLHEEALDAYPPDVRRHVDGEGEGPWRRLDLTAWSRAARGTPVYPAERACLGLAEALAARYGGPHPLRVLLWGRANPWNGRRGVVECRGADAIRRHGDRYRLNAHPASPAP
jgi:hypothetical protein